MWYRLLVWLALPVLWAWARGVERRALREGRPLRQGERWLARLAGVRHAGRIRVCEVLEMPRPGLRWMQGVAARWGLSMDDTLGLSLRYGIYLRKGMGGKLETLAHECVHTAQYERLGGLWAFLERYLRECLAVGYERAPMEREAAEQAPRLVLESRRPAG